METEKKSLYERYQAIVEHSESGDLKVTIAVLAVVAGFLGLASETAGTKPENILATLYLPTTVVFISPMFLYGTWFSWWKRYRVLYVVSKLVSLEEEMGIPMHLRYWTDTKWRPWAYVLFVCPWPWLILFFALGAVKYGRDVDWGNFTTRSTPLGLVRHILQENHWASRQSGGRFR